MSQAGWKHWILVTGLFGLAAVCAITAAAYPWAQGIFPVVTGYVTTVAISPVSWFVVIMAALFIPSARKVRSYAKPPSDMRPGNYSDRAPCNNENPLSNLSNEDLTSRVHTLIHLLKGSEFAENTKELKESGQMDLWKLQHELRLESNTSLRDALKQRIEEKEKAISVMNQRLLARRLAGFNRKYAQDVIRMKVELSKRTGKAINGPDDYTLPLLSEHQIDDNSLSQLCDQLSEMADLIT